MWQVRDVGHLTTEAVAAFVDGELSSGAADRAKLHLVHCSECREEVRHQRQAAERVRTARSLGQVRAPGPLLERLSGIPATCSDPETTDGGETDHGTVGVDGCRRPETLGDRLSMTVRRALRVSHTDRDRR